MSVDILRSDITAYTPAVTPEEPWMTVRDWKRSIKVVRAQGRESMKAEILAMVNSCLVADESLKKLAAAIEEME